MKMRKMLAAVAASAAMLMGTFPQTVLTVCAEEGQQVNTITMYATANVNVRAGDSTSANRLGALTKGQTVVITGKTDKGWYSMDFNGQTGYVSGKYLTDGTPVQQADNTVTANANPAVQTSSTSKTVNGITFVHCGVSPKGLQIWCLEGDTGAWGDDMITAYDATGITNEMSDYDKAVAINNYICKVIDYDYDFANGVVNYRPASETGRHSLTSGRGICMDYSEAFDCLCTMAGVYSKQVFGRADNRQEIVSHAWNYVIAEGTQYWVDPCWNDTTNNSYLMSTTAFADHIYEREN